MSLEEAKKAHKKTPNNKETQEQYCRAYAAAEYPDYDGTRCLTPWCKRKSKSTFCPNHNLLFPAWLGKRWDVNLEKFSKYDWQYVVDVDYDTDHDCHAGGCTEEGICRCGRITNARIEGLSHKAAIQPIINALIDAHTDLQAYCIDRVVRSHLNTLDDFAWEINIGRGYYGQEIDSVSLEETDSIINVVRDLLKLETDKERIFHALKAEYGRVLPKLEGLDSWTIEELPLKKVLLPQREYQKKLSTQQIKMYETWWLPRGLVLAENNGYRVIDGYHRTQSAIDQKLKTASFLVARP